MQIQRLVPAIQAPGTFCASQHGFLDRGRDHTTGERPLRPKHKVPRHLDLGCCFFSHVIYTLLTKKLLARLPTTAYFYLLGGAQEVLEHQQEAKKKKVVTEARTAVHWILRTGTEDDKTAAADTE